MDWATFNNLVGKATVIASVGTACVYLVKRAIKDGNEEDPSPKRPQEKQNASQTPPVAPR